MQKCKNDQNGEFKGIIHMFGTHPSGGIINVDSHCRKINLLMNQTKKTLIFIVDDDPLYNKLIYKNLSEEEHYSVLVFESGEECIDNLNKKPDLIILDYEMKGLNGIQTLKKIKEYNKDIKVIFCSSQEDISIIYDSLKFGATNYVRKNEFAYNKIKFLTKNILN